MITFVLAAALAAAQATPAPRPTASPTPRPSPSAQAAPAGTDAAPPPEFIAAAQAFGQCVGNKAQAQPASVTPEAAARAALAGCATERTALDTRFEGWIAGSTFPEAGRATAREQYKASMAAAEGQIAAKIKEGRAQAAAAPAPAPVPSPSAMPRR